MKSLNVPIQDTQEFIKELERFCKKNDILITFDEMQAGFYRTGKKNDWIGS